MKQLIAILLLQLLSLSLFAVEPIYSREGLAIRGFDPVAYFTVGEPTQGDAQYYYQWQGVTWLFASLENRNKFVTNPEAYAPQYGGYCAWAMASGRAVKTQPQAWSIVDNKLYLNYSRGVQKQWEEDVPGFIQAADKNWPSVLAN